MNSWIDKIEMGFVFLNFMINYWVLKLFEVNGFWKLILKFFSLYLKCSY